MFTVDVELDDETSRKVQAVLATSGVSAATVMQKVFTRIARDGVLPSEAYEPNAETIAAMEAADRGELVTFGTIEEMFADLHADD
jgi:DNA-damage-inducible protein J